MGIYIIGGFLRGYGGETGPTYEGLPPYPYFVGTPNTTDPETAGVMETAYVTSVSGTGVSGDYRGFVFDGTKFMILELPVKSSYDVVYSNCKYAKVRPQPDGGFVFIPGVGTTVYHIDPTTWAITPVVKPSAIGGSNVYDYYRTSLHTIWCTDAGFFVWNRDLTTIDASDTSGPCYTGFEIDNRIVLNPLFYGIGNTLKIGKTDGAGGVTVTASYTSSYNIAYVTLVLGYVYYASDYVTSYYATWDDVNGTLGTFNGIWGNNGLTEVGGQIYVFSLSANERTAWAVGYNRRYDVGTTTYGDLGNYMVGLDFMFPLTSLVGWRVYYNGYLVNYDWKNGVVTFLPDIFSDVLTFTYDVGIANLTYQHSNETSYDLSTGSVSAGYDAIGINGIPKGVVIAYNGI